jgi:hypothetical protein
MATNFRGPSGKLIRSLLASNEGHGWVASRTSKGHWRLINSTGEIVIFSGSPSHQVTVKTMRTNLKRAVTRKSL